MTILNYSSPQYLKRMQDMWEAMAKEPIRVEFVKGFYYAYGSELATLRIYKNYFYSKKSYHDYNKINNEWIFSLNTDIE